MTSLQTGGAGRSSFEYMQRGIYILRILTYRPLVGNFECIGPQKLVSSFLVRGWVPAMYASTLAVEIAVL